MSDVAVNRSNPGSIEAGLREQLAQDDAMAEAIAPILRHLLTSNDNTLFGDEIIARVRGMVHDLATQMLERFEPASGPDREGYGEHDLLVLYDALIADRDLLCHLHALALEWQLTERLQSRLNLDPVLSPLLQALIASPDPQTADLAVRLLASQARFGQAQRRMKLPISELPGDLLHNVLLAIRSVPGANFQDERISVSEHDIRTNFDESAGRLGLISRLVTGMGGGVIAALSLTHAGVAVFLSALAYGSAQDRDSIVLSTSKAQTSRFALALRAAGQKPSAIEEQVLTLHPDQALPNGFTDLGADQAAAILAVRGSCTGT